VVLVTAPVPPHVARVLEPLSRRGIGVSQSSAIDWLTECPRCRSELKVSDVEWAGGGHRATLYCARCPEEAVVRALGLRERDLFGSRAAHSLAPGNDTAPSEHAIAVLSRTGLIDGAAFALDEPTAIQAIWGEGTNVLWPAGEPTMLYGPDGVGKTTVGQQLMLRRIGVGGTELFSQPVAPAAAKVLYLAMDRPKQAARSLRRMVSPEDREVLRERLVVWRGALPISIVDDPGALARFVADQGAGTVFIDSLKDLVPKLSDEDTGSAIHRAWQACVESGQEVFALHHPRKAQADNKKPRTLADVYGSRWITAACGSVLLLWGDAGDPIVALEHLKQPGDVVGPFKLLHDNRAGTTSVVDSGDVVALVAAQDGPTTVSAIAAALFRRAEPDRNQIEKARRRLEAEVENGRLERLPAEAGAPVLYRPAGGSRRGSRGVTQGATPDGHAAPHVVEARDPRSRHASPQVTLSVDADAELERIEQKFPDLQGAA
jgi:hypothetical protein